MQTPIKTIKKSKNDLEEIKKEDLKKWILALEKKQEYSSDKFIKIEEKIKDSIARQVTDEALRDITVGAMVLGSSDIHYECFEGKVVIRFRIDGVLVDIFTINYKEYKLLLERLKYSANLKLNIISLPQDGKYNIKIEDRKIDIRVSILPTKYGENAVCRILDSEKSIVSFEDLGFFWTAKRIVEKTLDKKNGMILVTGPTGSGKTTTLYTMLSKLNTREKKIITLEDPIEYEMPGVIQTEVSEKVGFTFESGLKAILRQDPDIVMVGEIRDAETLTTAVNASLTGHLVLSTLHTKSATETIDRIFSMGLKPYIMASAIDVIIAQRLVRKICPHCKVEKNKTPQETALIKAMMEEIDMKNISTDSMKLYQGTGCEICNKSGYKGRVGIYEIIHINENIRDMIRLTQKSEDIIKAAKETGFISMKEDGILKAMKGYTTIEEVLRVI
ncbi:type II secretion system protein GspE [Candidatus Gracilibacteria bacterium]|nr:type II secretion system protein GspE [Candidatus Gracilibacteria bacterium]